MEFQYIDTHAHVNLKTFDEDREAVLERCREEGVAVINIGTKLSTSHKAVEVAEANEGQYAIIGLHPIQITQGDHDEKEIGPGGEPFVSKGEEFDTEAFRELAKSEKVVGIGECGFDYYRCDENTKGVQEEQFIKQIELANELGLPLMIHTRDAKGNTASAAACGRSAYDDVCDVLERYAKVPGNIHFYSGTWEQAKKFFAIGFTISFTGVITFAKDYEEVVRNAPLAMIHAETDCPFVAPVPHRGQRAEPQMVIEVYRKIAELKNMSVESVRLQLLENANRLYFNKKN